MAQTTYQAEPDLGLPGDPADSGFADDLGYVVEEANGIPPGLLVLRGIGGDKTARLPPAVAADSDSIMTATATVAGDTDYGAGLDVAFDGEIGSGLISPPRPVQLVIGAHADIAADDWTLVYKDADGVERTEVFDVVENVGGTFTTAYAVSYVISLNQPTQDGTGGSWTLGTTAAASLDGGDVIGVSVRRERGSLNVSNSADWEDGEEMPVRNEGRILVTVENAFNAGDKVLVRVVAGVGEQLGAFRASDSDGGDCIEWSRGRLKTSGAAGEIGVLEVKRG